MRGGGELSCAGVCVWVDGEFECDRWEAGLDFAHGGEFAQVDAGEDGGDRHGRGGVERE